MSFCAAGARDFAPCQKWAKREGFVAFPENDGRRGTFEEDLARCIFSGRGSRRDMFIKDVRRSGRWFPERDCILEHQIFSFGKGSLTLIGPLGLGQNVVTSIIKTKLGYSKCLATQGGYSAVIRTDGLKKTQAAAVAYRD